MRNSFSPRRDGGRALRLLLKICVLSLVAPAWAAAQTAAPGERISINSGWRFQSGDPADLTTPLMYDVRPVVTLTEDGKEADAKPEEAAKVAAANQQTLKPWILPSGNAFIKDPSRRYQRPPGDPGSNVSYVQASFDDSTWRNVTLPHDWAITGPFIAEGPYGGMGRLPSWGIGWYRKKLEIPASDRGRSIFLDIDGAMSYATVWLNGKLVGGWPYGYNSFRLDLTPHVTFGGANQLVVRLDNPPHSARWYPGGGLYRNVWLTKTDRVHVSHWGTQVTTPQVSKSSATVAVAVSIDNDSQTEASVDVSTDLYSVDADGKRTGGVVAKIKHGSARVAAGASAQVAGSITLASPACGGLDRPKRRIVTSL